MSDRTCLIDECGGKPQAHGWCPMHYQRWRRNGDPLALRPRPTPPAPEVTGTGRGGSCAADECLNVAFGRGLCSMHYARWRKAHPEQVQRRPRGRVCAVDDCGERIHGASYCLTHYTRWKSHGDPLWEPEPRPDWSGCICSDDQCEKPVDVAGWCWRHYQREWRRRDPERTQAMYKKRRAQKMKVPTETIVSSVVFDRDAWVCHLCNEPISPFLVFPDRMSATIDHVVPLIRGGSHTYDNVRAAHFICNARKGSRMLEVAHAIGR